MKIRDLRRPLKEMRAVVLDIHAMLRPGKGAESGGWKSGTKRVKVFINATPSTILDLWAKSEKNILRGITNTETGESYWWGGRAGTHQEVRRELGLSSEQKLHLWFLTPDAGKARLYFAGSPAWSQHWALKDRSARRMLNHPDIIVADDPKAPAMA